MRVLLPHLNAQPTMAVRVTYGLLVAPYLLGNAWLVFWWVSGSATRGGFLSLGGYLRVDVPMTHLANYWALAVVGGVPFQLTIFLFGQAHVMTTIANKVAREHSGLTNSDAHPALVQQAQTFFAIDFAMLVPFAFAVYVTIVHFIGMRFMVFEGVARPVALGVAIALLTTGFLYAPFLLRTMRTIAMVNEGANILTFVRRRFLPQCYVIIFLACVLFAYVGMLAVGSPPFTLDVAAEPLTRGNPCDLAPNAPFGEYTCAEAACAAKTRYFEMRLKAQSGLGLWLNAFAAVIYREIAVWVQSQPTKFPLAPLAAQLMAAGCLCGFVPMQIAFIVLDGSGDEVIRGRLQTCATSAAPHVLLSSRARVSAVLKPSPRGGHT